MTADPLTRAAVEQLDRLAAAVANLREAINTDGADPDGVSLARVTVLAHDTADQLVRLGAECYP